MTVDWNLEISRYNDPSLDNRGYFDVQAQCQHYSPNFRGGVNALLDDSSNPVCMLYDVQYLYGNFSIQASIQSRYQAATIKGRALEQQYGLAAGSLTQALFVGMDTFSRVSSMPSALGDLCGGGIKVQASCAAGQNQARNDILSLRPTLTTFFDVLQQIEAAATPPPASVPVSPA